MSFLIQGTTTFLGLTDTPGAYAGEQGRGCRVNAAEDALEFGAMYEGPVSPIYTTDVIFGPAAGPAAWTDLDVGVGPCIAIIKIVSAVATGHEFRRNGDTKNLNVSNLTQADTAAARTLNYVMVITDNAGLVEWRNGGANVTLTRICYWPNIPMPNWVLAGAAGPAAYADINLGIPDAMVLLKIETTSVGGYVARFRHNGETQAVTGGISVGFPTSTVQEYILIPTDSEGIVEWLGSAAADYTITVLGYILGATFPNLVLFNGVPPDGNVFDDLDTPLGRGWCYIRGYHSAVGAAIACRFRENGEALITQDVDGIVTFDPAVPDIQYCLIPLDVYGTNEWCYRLAATGQIIQIRAEAMLG